MSKIKVVRVAPLQNVQVVEIDNSYQAMQKEVGGFIESHYYPAYDLQLICNEEGKMIGLPSNRPLFHNSRVYDVVMGTFLVTNTDDEGESIDVTEAQIARAQEAFDGRFVL